MFAGRRGCRVKKLRGIEEWLRVSLEFIRNCRGEADAKMAGAAGRFIIAGVPFSAARRNSPHHVTFLGHLLNSSALRQPARYFKIRILGDPVYLNRSRPELPSLTIVGQFILIVSSDN